MLQYSISRQILLLAAVLLLFELTNWDMQFQQSLFLAQGQWLLSKDQAALRLILYDGPKVGLGLLFLMCLLLLVLSWRYARLKDYRKGLAVVLVSLLLVPGSVSMLKSHTNVACPTDLQVFGGEVAYVGNLGRYQPQQQPAALQKCFPAGHASGGFALLSMFFVFKTRRNRLRALFIALTVGWLMGGYKMAIGDHFLSHTIVSMQLAWLLIILLVIIQRKFCSPKDQHHTCVYRAIGEPARADND